MGLPEWTFGVGKQSARARGREAEITRQGPPSSVGHIFCDGALPSWAKASVGGWWFQTAARIKAWETKRKWFLTRVLCAASLNGFCIPYLCFCLKCRDYYICSSFPDISVLGSFPESDCLYYFSIRLVFFTEKKYPSCREESVWK